MSSHTNEMTMVERVGAAIDAADINFRMTLVRLVDGVHTYHLVYDGEPAIEFDNTDDLYDHVRTRKFQAKARAAIEAMREPSEGMLAAVFTADLTGCIVDDDSGLVRTAYTAAIDAALQETKG
jgi:hypothetical protein